MFEACSPASHARPVRISSECVYFNDYYVPGVGYYHAPFHAFFQHPYNYFNATTGDYYFGGLSAKLPYESPINISSPTDAAALVAEAMRTDVVRGGFGGSSWGYGGS